jgi:hypothetical protein
VTLLAILKTGAAYSWERPDDSAVDVAGTEGVSIMSAVGGVEQCRLPIVTHHDDSRPQPNLPVLTRGSDIACVLPGSSPMLIPHGTVSALHVDPAGPSAAWTPHEETIGIWLTLMAGQAVTSGNLRPPPAA